MMSKTLPKSTSKVSERSPLKIRNHLPAVWFWRIKTNNCWSWKMGKSKRVLRMGRDHKKAKLVIKVSQLCIIIWILVVFLRKLCRLTPEVWVQEKGENSTIPSWLIKSNARIFLNGRFLMISASRATKPWLLKMLKKYRLWYHPQATPNSNSKTTDY